MENDLFTFNRRRLLENKKTTKLFSDLNECNVFLEDLSYLFFGRTYIVGKCSVNCSDILDSLNCTLKNAIECAKNYCLADSMTLLRKFKDDLWFVLYVLTYNKIHWNIKNENNVVQNINDWMNNNLRYLTAANVINSIFKINKLKCLDEKYNVKSSLQSMARKMDDYIHSNGISFYNSSFINVDEKTIDNICTIKNYVFNNILFFILVLAISFPNCLASSDYEDYLDYNCDVPEGCQYWIAPFVTDFISKFKDNLDSNLESFLEKYSCMDFGNI